MELMANALLFDGDMGIYIPFLHSCRTSTTIFVISSLKNFKIRLHFMIDSFQH